MKYKTRSKEVQAEQWNPKDVLQTERLRITSYYIPNGDTQEIQGCFTGKLISGEVSPYERVFIMPGDWVVTDGDLKFRMTNEEFEKKYESNPRQESGAIKFGDDWPGLFLRGDDAFHLAMSLKSAIEVIGKSKEIGATASIITTSHLQGIVDTILNDVVVKPVIKERKGESNGV